MRSGAHSLEPGNKEYSGPGARQHEHDPDLAKIHDAPPGWTTGSSSATALASLLLSATERSGYTSGVQSSYKICKKARGAKICSLFANCWRHALGEFLNGQRKFAGTSGERVVERRAGRRPSISQGHRAL